MSASIISRSDASPILDSAEHVFDVVTLLVERFVVVGRMLSLFAWRDAWSNTPVFQGIAEPVGIVTAIGKQFPGFGQAIEQVAGTRVVTGLTFREKKQQGPPQAVGDSMELGVQAALCSSDTAGKSPFFNRLAAVRWALRCVASIISLSG